MKKLFQKNDKPNANQIGRHVKFRVNHVIIDGIIDYGGYSVIFSVKNNKTRQALKRTNVSDKDTLAACLMEIKVMRECPHPNIIQYVESSVLKVDSQRSSVFILMEMCTKSLVRVLQENAERGLPQRRIRTILTDICRGLSALHHHSPPIINRDVKVENVLVNAKGDYVLCDFGSATFDTGPREMESAEIAKLQDEIARVTTLGYRAPEMTDIYCGEHISCKADIWAVGCLLYKLCFLQMPFDDNILAILSARYSFPANSSLLLRNIIENCLVICPQKRPNVDAILESVQTDVPISQCAEKVVDSNGKVNDIPDDVFLSVPFRFPNNPWPLDDSMFVLADFGRNNPFCTVRDGGLQRTTEEGCVNDFFRC